MLSVAMDIYIQDPRELNIYVSFQHYVDHRKLFLEVPLGSDKYTLWYTELSCTFILHTPM